MATSAQKIIDDANILLQDIDNVRWSQSELIDWINEGQLKIVNFQPSAHSEYIVMDLVPGTRQTIPSNSFRLLDVLRNQDGIYNTAIRQVARIDLDTQVPNWHNHKPNTIVQHYMYDSQAPDYFYVYPPQPDPEVMYNLSQGSVEALLATYPPTITDVEDEIDIHEIYVPLLVDYVVFRAYAKDSESSASNELKTQYWAQFSQGLTGQGSTNTGTAP